MLLAANPTAAIVGGDGRGRVLSCIKIQSCDRIRIRFHIRCEIEDRSVDPRCESYTSSSNRRSSSSSQRTIHNFCLQRWLWLLLLQSRAASRV